MSDIAYAQHGPVENAQRPDIFSKIFGSLFTFSANSPATTSARTRTSFWENVKTMFNQAQASIFPPNLDFRRSDEAVGHGGVTGTAEKMKEGAAKSVEKGKATVENSARTAARVASETVQKIKEKVKRTASDHKTGTRTHDEL
ncbi:PREDICTED: uncharacterized protein LOC105141166 [Populus euphratica]|uniref:Uncharacterized protein LOC105141166 n=1 Tax=Populus euphratica TaxID=75702 RepID=A0AAJ6Y8P3_POPEU|nr:PREDICTED: uncharacterized protein LOC105141166 [Populus euphratica]